MTHICVVGNQMANHPVNLECSRWTFQGETEGFVHGWSNTISNIGLALFDQLKRQSSQTIVVNLALVLLKRWAWCNSARISPNREFPRIDWPVMPGSKNHGQSWKEQRFYQTRKKRSRFARNSGFTIKLPEKKLHCVRLILCVLFSIYSSFPTL